MAIYTTLFNISLSNLKQLHIFCSLLFCEFVKLNDSGLIFIALCVVDLLLLLAYNRYYDAIGLCCHVV